MELFTFDDKIVDQTTVYRFGIRSTHVDTRIIVSESYARVNGGEFGLLPTSAGNR